jgi:hypothetical protein
MPRPKKPLSWHLLTNNYRPSRHGPLHGRVASPAKNGPEPVEASTLDADLTQWEGFLMHGVDYFDELPDGITEKQARRMAREVWQSLGKRFMETRKPDPTGLVPWALERFGEP